MLTPNSSSRFAIDIGTVIADTYRIDGMIGRGGMGAVFVASHVRLPGAKVAIKVLHTGVDDADVLARFKREAEIAARLDHPNIVDVIDVNLTADGTPYLILEYLRGTTLADRIAAGPLPFEQIVRIVRQVGSALAAAHREGIVHRDLKPQNIFLVRPEGENTIEVAKVLDFGISKIRGSQTVKTQDNALLGTPQYMAPEQATGKHENVDERTDVFALGAIVHEMVTGAPAFTGASIPEVVFKVVYEPAAPLPATVHPDVAAAITRAMAKPAVERFSTIDSFVEALTGTKLSGGRVVIDPPAAPDSFAAGSKHTVNQGGAELASTLASGDHGPASKVGMADTIDSAKLPASMVPTPPSSVSASSRSAIVDTQPATTSTLAAVSATPSAGTTSSSSQVMASATTKATAVATDSRSIWGKVLAAGGAIAAAAIALIVFVGVGSDKSEQRSADNGALDNKVATGAREPASDTKPVDEPLPARAINQPVEPTVAASTPTTTPDPGLATGSAAPGKQPPTKPDKRVTKNVVTKPSADDDEGGDDDPTYKEAVAALQLRSPSALALANRLVDSAPPGSKKRARALVLRGRVQCTILNKDEAALADVRALEAGGNRRAAARLRELCKLDQ